MAKNQTTHYIARNNHGGYWGGVNGWVDQKRKALMYNSTKQLRDSVEREIKSFNKRYPDFTITHYEIVEVEIVEIGNPYVIKIE
jgi:hypothetical protein